jgi:glycosyltransferase involved in cell wall biosynthesis
MIANFDWWPNRQGLAWFTRHVLPSLEPTVRVHLFGHGSVRAAPRDSRVVAHGFVPRIEDAFSACDLMICPIRSGGGVSIKLAEAMYHGVPVLATRFATRGLDLVSGAAAVLLDDAEDWIGFLNDASVRFATQIVPTAMSDYFHVSRHAQRSADFLTQR